MPRALGVLEQIKQACNADTAGWSRKEIVLRYGFFYRGGLDADKIKDRVVQSLSRATIQGPGECGEVVADVVDHGEVWTAFDGGKPLAKQSHWWVRLKLRYADET